MEITMKIGRKSYKVTEDDRFLDNGNCVQLITQSKEKSSWGHKPDPILSKKLEKQVKSMQTIEYPTTYKSCVLFGLVLDS